MTFPWLFNNRKDYEKDDADLQAYRPFLTNVVIGAIDSGLFISKRDKYLYDHLADVDDEPNDTAFEKSLISTPKNVISAYHGTSAAALAVFGCASLGILMVRATGAYFSANIKPTDLWGTNVDWLVDKGAKVVYINFEWSKKHSTEFNKMIAKHSGILFVTNAGNFVKQIEFGRWARTTKGTPNNLLMVGGCTSTGTATDWGYHQTFVDVAVFADDTWRLYNPEEFSAQIQNSWTSDRWSERTWKDRTGTVSYSFNEGNLIVGKGGVSFGTPVAANVAAKMLLINPALTAAQLRTLIINSAKKTDDLRGKNLAGGYIDAPKAYEAAAHAKQSHPTLSHPTLFRPKPPKRRPPTRLPKFKK